jgi:hypothetical protein
VFAQNWGITISNSGTTNGTVVLENPDIRVEYGLSSTNDIQIRALVCKATGTNMGNFDGGIDRKNETLTASIHSEEPDNKVVRLAFGANIRMARIYSAGAFVDLGFLQGAHVWDQGGAGGATGGQFEVHGAQQWLAARAAAPATGDPCAASSEPFLYGGMDQTELYPCWHKSYWCKDWGLAPDPLLYRNWMIMGYHRNGQGFGIVHQVTTLDWLKVMCPGTPGQRGGYERWMRPQYKAIYYVVGSGGGAEILAYGKRLVDWIVGDGPRPGALATSTNNPLRLNPVAEATAQGPHIAFVPRDPKGTARQNRMLFGIDGRALSPEQHSPARAHAALRLLFAQ